MSALSRRNPLSQMGPTVSPTSASNDSSFSWNSVLQAELQRAAPSQASTSILGSGLNRAPAGPQPWWASDIGSNQGEMLMAQGPAQAAAPPASLAYQMGNTHGVRQATGGLKNINGDAATKGAISNASGKTGVSVDDLTAMAIIESTGNRNVGTNRFGYTGLMQMGDLAAQDVGMPYRSLVGGGNVKNNALAGAKYWQVNDKRLNEGIPRDPLHMYLAHQQGAGGTNALMDTLKSNPNARATRNQRNNLPANVVKALGGKVSQQDFYDYWRGKMGAIQQQIRDSK